MDLSFTPEDTAFRARVRQWFEANLPREELKTLEERVAWHRKLYAAGYVGMGWPKDYGGQDARPMEQAIVQDEMARVNAPSTVNGLGLSIVGPTIIHHGTPEQKARFLKKILNAEEIWCQGFSEPGAGSDLAGVQTSAVRDGDNWIINGHKVWTSLAHFASWMILLARHSSADKYNGLTYFITPIAGAPGVTVRPLIKLTGQTGFNEVLFEDAIVPDTLRVDKVGMGWQVAMTTLLHERGTLGFALTAALEAGLLGIPAITFSDMYFGGLSSVHLCSDITTLRDLICRLLNSLSRDYEADCRFMDLLLRNSYDGFWSDPNLSPEMMETENMEKLRKAFLSVVSGDSA